MIKGQEEIRELLNRRRRQCIVHRIIYYCRNDNLIPDATYDAWERELKALCAAHPDIAADLPYAWLCPSRCVGSSDVATYPAELVALANSLLATRNMVVDRPAPATKGTEDTQLLLF